MTTEPEPKGIAERTSKALEEGLLILFRTKNHRVDYSIMNRPLITEVDDHALATAIVHAGSTFEMIRRSSKSLNALARLGTKHPKDEKVHRVDGRTVTYKESIDIDWQNGTIKSTKGLTLTLQVLSIVVENLIAAAQQATAAKDQHGPN